MPKLGNKEKLLKTSREKHQLLYKGQHVRITSNFSAQTLKASKAGSYIV
jgi:hypothetical protein